jgi:hypothetical protein
VNVSTVRLMHMMSYHRQVHTGIRGVGLHKTQGMEKEKACLCTLPRQHRGNASIGEQGKIIMAKIICVKCNGSGFCLSCNGTGFIDAEHLGERTSSLVTNLLRRADLLYEQFNRIRDNISNQHFVAAIDSEYLNLKNPAIENAADTLSKFVAHINAVMPIEQPVTNTAKPIRTQARLNLGPIPSRNPIRALPKRKAHKLEQAYKFILNKYRNLSRDELIKFLRNNQSVLSAATNNAKRKRKNGKGEKNANVVTRQILLLLETS